MAIADRDRRFYGTISRGFDSDGHPVIPDRINVNNGYLKEIGDMAEIPNDKPLVSHLARKTFACTIGLANGMNIGVLSKILGHASMQVTLDSYATVIDSLMLQNVHDLKMKLK